MAAASKKRSRSVSPGPSRVDEQGRTIIPKEVREALGLKDGGFVIYEVEGSTARVRRVDWVAK